MEETDDIVSVGSSVLLSSTSDSDINESRENTTSKNDPMCKSNENEGTQTEMASMATETSQITSKMNGLQLEVIIDEDNMDTKIGKRLNEETTFHDFDDVFGSDPAWIDVPEEYLNISATPCLEGKDSFSSDLSFDIEAILNSIKCKTVTEPVEDHSSGGSRPSALDDKAAVVGIVSSIPSQEEQVIETLSSTTSGECCEAMLQQTKDISSTPSIHEKSEDVNESNLQNSSLYKEIGHHDTYSKDSCVLVPDTPEQSIESQISESTSNTSSFFIDKHKIGSTSEHDTTSSSVETDATKPGPQTHPLIINNSRDSKSATLSQTRTNKQVVSEKGSLKKPTRSLKKPGQLLPSKPTYSSKPSQLSKPQTGAVKPTSSTSKKTYPLPSSKTGLTRQTNSRLKQPACEIKAPLLLSKRLVSAGSDKPNRPQPVKTVPVRESLKNNGGPSVPRMGVKAKTMLQKPKNGSTIDKASIQTKVVSKSQLPIKTESPILTPKRRSIATSTPSKSTRLDGVNSLESTPILSKKKNGTFIKEDNATANVVVNERKKRRSLIPTPSKKKDVSPIKRVLVPLPINIDDKESNGNKKPLPKINKGLALPTKGKTGSLLRAPRNTKGKNTAGKPLVHKPSSSSSSSLQPEYDPDFESQILKQQQNKLCPKIVHSPIDKENRPITPHSEWSPIKRTKDTVIAGEECFQCTKYTKIRQFEL